MQLSVPRVLIRRGRTTVGCGGRNCERCGAGGKGGGAVVPRHFPSQTMTWLSSGAGENDRRMFCLGVVSYGQSNGLRVIGQVQAYVQ